MTSTGASFIGKGALKVFLSNPFRSCCCIDFSGVCMKAFGKILAAAILAGGASAPVLAQLSDAESTSSSVRIIQGIALTKVNNLAFGTIVRPSSGSNTVTIAVGSDTPALGGGGDAVLLSSGAKTRASYTATGEGNQSVSITVPATVTMNGSVSGSIVVTLTPEATSDTLSGALGTTGGFSGDGTLYVGGAFSISNTTVSGDYSGSFSTTLAYN